jgi:hypothetical protein
MQTSSGSAKNATEDVCFRLLLENGEDVVKRLETGQELLWHGQNDVLRGMCAKTRATKKTYATFYLVQLSSGSVTL